MSAARKTILALAAILAVHAALYVKAPQVAARSAGNSLSGLAAIGAILPAVLLLISLFDAWVPRDLIERSLGRSSGFRGFALAVFLGSAAAGPLYAAFPVGQSLRNKGARTANLVIFLGSWATIKVPMLLMEGAFLGLRFAVIRLCLTLPGIIVCGLLMERWCETADTEPSMSVQPS